MKWIGVVAALCTIGGFIYTIFGSHSHNIFSRVDPLCSELRSITTKLAKTAENGKRTALRDEFYSFYPDKVQNLKSEEARNFIKEFHAELEKEYYQDPIFEKDKKDDPVHSYKNFLKRLERINENFLQACPSEM